MSRIKIVELNEQQRKELVKGFKYGSTPSFRLRCQALLLKSEKRTSLSVAKEIGCCEVAVNNWMKRFSEQGMAGLRVAKGRGRKGILQAVDLEKVRKAVQSSRQRIGLAKADLEKELEKEFSQLTLRRFVKKMVDASNAMKLCRGKPRSIYRKATRKSPKELHRLKASQTFPTGSGASPTELHHPRLKG